MSQQNIRQRFTEIHHALLFGWMSKAIIERVGEQKGQDVVSHATRKYGEERGKRMALRAKAHKQPLNTANFFVYAEYRPISGKMKAKVAEKSRNLTLEAYRCPWVMPGKRTNCSLMVVLYCLDVDKAILHGFNPNLKMQVESTLSGGAEKCRLVYNEANLTLFSYLLMGYKRAISPGKKVVMPWEYHVGHLFKTFETSIIEELGAIRKAGSRICSQRIYEVLRRISCSADFVFSCNRLYQTSRFFDVVMSYPAPVSVRLLN